MTSDDARADFVVLPGSGPARYGRRESGELLYEAIRRHVPDLGTRGIGRLRLWFADTFTGDLAPNDVADRVIAALGYQHPSGWYGPVAVSMEEDPRTGEAPPLLPQVRAAIDELTAAEER